LENLKNAFCGIGSRVRVTAMPEISAGNIPARRNDRAVTLPGIQVSVSRDRKGEFFDISAHESVDVQVMNMDKTLKHLLLFARDRNDSKYRYLCGRDERGLFAAAVPGAVSSVAGAMEALKPDTVVQSQEGLTIKKRNKRRNRAFRRQGEWFFVPAPDLDPAAGLIRYNEPVRRGRSRAHIVEEVFRRGGEAVYVCRKYPNGLGEKEYRDLMRRDAEARRWQWTVMRKNMDVFGRGKVTHPDHRTIELNGWHKIIPNRETEAWFIETLVFLD
jgi:hypothetical protein